MKYIVVVILIAIGVFLFRRAQRLAKEEQEALKPKSTGVKPAVPSEESAISSAAIEPERIASEPVIEVEGTRVVEVEPVIEVEAELMPREAQERVTSVEMTADIIEADALAAHNEDAVIILAAEPRDTGSPADRESTSEPVPDAAPEAELKPPAPATVEAPYVQTDIIAPAAWANVTLQRAFEEYRQATSTFERYTAVQNMIGECYKQRKSADYLNYGAQLAEHYIALFETTSAEQGQDSGLKTVGFLQLATLLNDTQAFDAAIILCRKAIELGLSDGTVTGFEGRIGRIEKAQAKVAKP